jgi:Arc/MetJ family transcription regulator
MRTNIELDDELVAEAMRLTGATTKREVVDTALRELIRSKKKKDLLDLVGKVQIDPDYDYKAGRRSKFDAG